MAAGHDDFKDPSCTPAAALARLGAREAIPELVNRLQHCDENIIQALADLEAKDALPRVFEVLSKPDSSYNYYFGLRAVGRAFPIESVPTMRLFLERDLSTNRVLAARLLCETGSSDGVPFLFESDSIAWSINAIRNPAAWRRLRSKSLDESFFDTTRGIARRLSKEAGLRLEEIPEGDPLFKAWAGFHRHIERKARSRTLVELWDQIQDGRWCFILESDRIRVVAAPEGKRFWMSWWEEHTRKR